MRAIARQALATKTGARGLRAILVSLTLNFLTLLLSRLFPICLMQAKVLLQPRYDVPGSGITEVIIDADAIMGRSKPKYVFGNTETACEEEVATSVDEDDEGAKRVSFGSAGSTSASILV